MKYSVDVTIDLPRDRVVELMDDFENFPHWQEGFLGYEHQSGTMGEVGAKTLLKYKMGKREMDMIETIISRNFPDEFSATYEAKGVWNLNKNYFKEAGPNKTKWTMDTEFKFSGFMKLIGKFMKGSFPKETLKQMNSFKKFAESI